MIEHIDTDDQVRGYVPDREELADRCDVAGVLVWPWPLIESAQQGIQAYFD